MPSRGGRRNHQLNGRRNATTARPPTPRRTWLAPPIGAIVIVVMAAAAASAQSTEWVMLGAALVFSLAEGVVLAVVGFAWSSRGRVAALLAAAATAAVAAPARWEVALLRSGQPVAETDLLADLLISIAWGAMVGLAGATILRPKLAALMSDARQRFSPPPE